MALIKGQTEALNEIRGGNMAGWEKGRRAFLKPDFTDQNDTVHGRPRTGRVSSRRVVRITPPLSGLPPRTSGKCLERGANGR